MSEEINDGGSAFPQVDSEWDDYDKKYGRVYSSGGMSLRDYFAAKAMQGFLASREYGGAAGNADTCAEWAYAHADAMLKARGKC